jgi:gluconate 5-dehydrogenase
VTDLTGTRILVTGATRGLGRAMASALLGAGARVVITSRRSDDAAAAAEALGAGAISLELDVRHESSVRRAVERVYKRLGGIDVLVNNAGIGMRTVNPGFMTDPQPFWQLSPKGFRDVMETKATGCFLVAREVIPHMLQAGTGHLVTISMNQATMVRRGFVPYGPSGAAVEAMARVMAADLASTPVRANILLPGGATETGMVPDAIPAEIRGRLLDPAIMGRPIVWLCSAEAKDVHDQRIVATEFDDWLAER